MSQITPEQCRAQRKLRGLSQVGLSKLAGLADNYVCRFENETIREPSGAKLSRIEKALMDTDVPSEIIEALETSFAEPSSTSAASKEATSK